MWRRGQVLTPTSLKTTETVELISNNVKYVLTATKTSETQYYVQCGDWNMEVDVYRFLVFASYLNTVGLLTWKLENGERVKQAIESFLYCDSLNK